jgi:outer membrane protein TolC
MWKLTPGFERPTRMFRSGSSSILRPGLQTGVRAVARLALGVVLLTVAVGCQRSRYRETADRDSYCILEQKSQVTPWELPPDFSIEPSATSRLAQRSSLDDPMLPEAGPFLYDYELPASNRAKPIPTLSLPKPDLVEPQPLPGLETREESSNDLIGGLEAIAANRSGAPSQPNPPVRLTPGKFEPTELKGWRPTESFRSHAVSTHIEREANAIQLVSNLDEAKSDEATENESELENPYSMGIGVLQIQPIPNSYWQALPPQCVSRMLEFASVGIEYRREYESAPAPELLDQSRKLDLDEIVEFGLLNSREFQTRKETLYQAALSLTLERYDYATKFSARATGADVNYSHNRVGGDTTDSLGIPSKLQSDRMLATGGNLLARFANSVILTFNGPDGFASDVSSELLFDVTQSVFQRDVLLNRLVQSERNVVYAARDYARFRKTFFLQLATQYYQLLQTYRQIEIATANYFSLVRALEQALAEVRAGGKEAPPRVQVDQIEQNVLNGRRSLISTCNNLERSLDQLKLTMGLPTEMPINLSLVELEKLTLRDEIEAAGELVRRFRNGLQSELDETPIDRAEVVSASVVLVERLLEWMRLRENLQNENMDDTALHELGARLQVDEARLDAGRVLDVLQQTKSVMPPAPPIFVLQRTLDVIDAKLILADRQDNLMSVVAIEHAAFKKNRLALIKRVLSVHARTDDILQGAPVDLQKAEPLQNLQQVLKKAQDDAAQMVVDVTALVRSGDRLLGFPAQQPAIPALVQQSVEQANRLLKMVQTLMSGTQIGLVPIDIHVDDAMVTALVQRLDLMNTRGFLADDWRGIKYAADDLKSALNLGVNQRFNTTGNRFADFSFDDSRTQLNLSLDLPFNRRAQRNLYRRSLIGYQQGLRELTQAEDMIKFDVRNNLRQLGLDKVQYEISVTSAALASERVYSTRLEFALGQGRVSARDFLEAQSAYRTAVTQVANGRIGYIIDRAEFALDLELMLLNDQGFWPQIYEEQYQLAPNFEYSPSAGPTYGEIPEFLKVSDDIKRMLHYRRPGSGNSTVVPVPTNEGIESN